MYRILIVEDDPDISMALEDDFAFEGFEVTMARDGQNGLALGTNNDFNIIILDVMLPKMNGFDVCKTFRSNGVTTPIIMLTAKSHEIDKVLGLEFGADDYITKPFSPRELQARVKAILRRSEMQVDKRPTAKFKFGDIQVDFDKYIICKKEKQLDLTTFEFSLLKFLLENENKVLSRDVLLDNLWGTDVIVDPRTVDTHIANLRRKLEDNPKKPRWIIGIRGVGYKIRSS